MSRSCQVCGTPFTEYLVNFKKGIFDPTDPIPQCWKDDKENGHCINCCSCFPHPRSKCIEPSGIGFTQE